MKARYHSCTTRVLLICRLVRGVGIYQPQHVRDGDRDEPVLGFGLGLRDVHAETRVARKAAKKMKSKMKTNVHGAFGREKDDRPRVLYIGHVPHGFYEDQMRAYFGQFGDVTRLRLSRNKKTGKSKHYAYCEFKHPEVAAIVAESMDNYLLFESVLKVRLMTAEECHPELWKGANRKFKAPSAFEDACQYVTSL